MVADSPASAVPRSFVAIGDSFTEGLDDPDPAAAIMDAGPERFRGWADRIADVFAARDQTSAYANLAVRGRKLEEIIDEQVPHALAFAPELVSLAGGTNDVLRLRVDFDRLSFTLDDAVRRLRENGSQVMLFQNVEPPPGSGLLGRILPRVKALTTLVEETAQRHRCVLVRLWGAEVFTHPAAWSVDRLHLSTLGHERVMGAALEALGMGDHTWAAAPPPDEILGRLQTARADLVWARRHLAPWIGRRLRGTSSGDSVQPKRPKLAPLR